MNSVKYIIVFCLCAWIVTNVFATMRDPTRPIEQPSTSVFSGAQDLQAIIFSADRRIAIINGTVLKIGDTFENSTVKAIEQSFVILDNSGEEKVLFLVGEPIKKSLNK